MKTRDCFRALRGEFPEIRGEDFEYIFEKTAGLAYGGAFVSDEDIPPEKISEIRKNLKKKEIGKPVEYIFGFARFMGLDFEISEGIFIPRNTTEILAGEVLEEAKDGNRIADVCCGCGVVAIVLAKMKKAEVFASDIDARAVALTRRNARRVGVEVKACQGDLFENLSGKFDIIVSNPPYVAEGEKLPREVLKENKIALLGGADGLDYIRKIAEGSAARLKKTGLLFLEIGHGQSGKTVEIMEKNGFRDIKTTVDLSGIPRVVRGRIA